MYCECGYSHIEDVKHKNGYIIKGTGNEPFLIFEINNQMFAECPKCERIFSG